MVKIKCKGCGFENETNSNVYDAVICRRCFRELSTGKEAPSLLHAISTKDNKLIKKIEKMANSGNIVRII